MQTHMPQDIHAVEMGTVPISLLVDSQWTSEGLTADHIRCWHAHYFRSLARGTLFVQLSKPDWRRRVLRCLALAMTLDELLCGNFVPVESLRRLFQHSTGLPQTTLPRQTPTAQFSYLRKGQSTCVTDAISCRCVLRGGAGGWWLGAECLLAGQRAAGKARQTGKVLLVRAAKSGFGPDGSYIKKWQLML